MPDSPWPDITFTLSDSELVDQARAAEVVKQIAATQYLSPHEMSKAWKEAAVLGQSCLQQVESGEVKHVPWHETLLIGPISPEETAALERVMRKSGQIGVVSVSSATELVPDQVTKEMQNAGGEAANEVCFRLFMAKWNSSDAEQIAVAAYRAMHAVAPVELVSDGELRAVKERDAAYGYLRRVFEHVAPQCTPLPDLMGICTQVDNVLAGARIDRDKYQELANYWCDEFGKAVERREPVRDEFANARAIIEQDTKQIAGLCAENDELKKDVALSRALIGDSVAMASEIMLLRDRVAFLESNVAPVDSTPKPDFTLVPTDDPRRMGWRGNR